MISGFTMLPSYYEALRPLPDDERLALYDAILDYAFASVQPTGLPPLLNGYFTLLRPNIDSSIRHYSASKENGKKGGRPPKIKPRENRTETQAKPDGNREKEMEMEMEMEKEMEKECESTAAKPPTRAKRFTPPTLEEVTAYIAERHSPVDPQGFIDFYEAKGWKVGKVSMKDWRAACRNAERWERWSKKPDSRDKVRTAADYKEATNGLW